MSDELDKHLPEVIYSDTPKDYRPDLSFYGIDEVEKGVCEDSFENRSILRVHRLNWQLIYNENGEPSGNIEVLSPEMSARRSEKTLEDRRVLLTDDRDLNSDFITEEALLIEEQSDILVPLWVTAATRTWIRIREARKDNPKAMPLIGGPPTRCRAIKSDGVRCMKWCTGRVTDDGLCTVHLGTKNNNLTGAVARARARAYQAAPTAVAILEQMMESAESEQVKLKAATEILDRAGVRGGIEIEAKVELTERPADDVIRERLARLVPQVAQVINVQPQQEDQSQMLEVEAAASSSTDTSDMEEIEILTVEVEDE